MADEMADRMSAEKRHAVGWFRQLRDELCAALEALEAQAGSKARFGIKAWQRQTAEQKAASQDDAGGGEMATLTGDIFEKAGVHISTVYGAFSEQFRAEISGTAESADFWAAGISVIIHPRNPNVPTAHMNTRMIVTGKSWFGGGGDLTPLLARDRRADHPDTMDFHRAFKRACDAHNADYYATFKAGCDEYFYLPHRNEPRGTGGIFYDHLNSGDWHKDFAFTKSVGEAFLETYPHIVARRMNDTFSDEDRAEQLMRRGRYVEFNLLYDRGTMFGLKTGGNVESILSSLPPLVAWP